MNYVLDEYICKEEKNMSPIESVGFLWNYAEIIQFVIIIGSHLELESGKTVYYGVFRYF
jgi:hypothetical protein